MKITTVSYQKTYSIGPYLTEKIGFEAVPEGSPGDAPLEMLTMLEELADEWHKKAHPNLYPDSQPANTFEKFSLLKESNNVAYSTNTIPIISKDTERLEIAIDNAPDLATLARYKEEAAKNGMISQYMRRISELSLNANTTNKP